MTTPPPTLITSLTRTPWHTHADTTLTILHAVDTHGTRWVAERSGEEQP